MKGRKPISQGESGPISAELWERLRRLDRMKDIEISMIRTCAASDSVWAATGVGRVWVVTIRSVAYPNYLDHFVQHIHPKLSEALSNAVEQWELQKTGAAHGASR